MATTYPVLAWSGSRIQVGLLEGRDLQLKDVGHVPPLEDIRNCSAARGNSLVAVSARDSRTGRQALWRLEPSAGRADLLVEPEYILHNSISPDGGLVCYVSTPSPAGGDMSLYAYGPSGPTLVVEGTLDRDAFPSWAGSGVLYHTADGKVARAAVDTRQVEHLFDGRYPSASPDGALIAFREGGAIRLRGVSDGETADRSFGKHFWEGDFRGGMSWSPDGKYLLAAQSAGALGYELSFSLIEVESGSRSEVRQRHLHGLVFA